MAKPNSRPTYRPPTDDSTNSTSPASPEQGEHKVMLDEIQGMAGDGTLENVLDSLGVPAATPAKLSRPTKRRVGEGPSFDRASFNQAEYGKRLADDSKR